MTYCLGILTSAGLVMAADSRTNAGVDYISTHQKLFDFSLPGDRVLVMCSSGNLSITQSVVTLIRRDLKAEETANLHNLSSLYDVARYVGEKIRQVQSLDQPWLAKDAIDASCTLLVGGQIQGEMPELYMVYAQGNCIQASRETPFLQIGEAKYGKPILDRVLTYDTPLEEAAKCALLSIDSTMKSNISVGPPIDLMMYEADQFQIKHSLKLSANTPYLVKIRHLWEACIRQAFENMPPIDWAHSTRAQSTQNSDLDLDNPCLDNPDLDNI